MHENPRVWMDEHIGECRVTQNVRRIYCVCDVHLQYQVSCSSSNNTWSLIIGYYVLGKVNFKIIGFTAGIIQLTEEFEFPAKTVFANNSMIIDLRLRF